MKDTVIGQRVGEKMFWKGEFFGHNVYIVPKDIRVTFSALAVPEGVSIRLPDNSPSSRNKGKARLRTRNTRRHL
jgi:hypothetical protein